jgi:hypothetical protein
VSELHLAYAPGVMPAKWLNRFTDTHQEDTLHARPLPEGIDPLEELAAGRARVVLLRFPEGASPAGPGLHVIELYTERAGLCAPKDHEVEYYDELAVIPAEDAAAWPRLDPADYPAEAGGVAMMLEVVASGAGAVAALPQPLARLHARKDVVWREVSGEPATKVGLAWLRVDPSLPDDEQRLAQEAQDDRLVEEFIGVVRGRKAGSSRQPSVREREQDEAVQRRKDRAAAQSAEAKAAHAAHAAQASGAARPAAAAAQGEDSEQATGGASSKRQGWAKAKQGHGTKGAKAAAKAAAKSARSKVKRPRRGTKGGGKGRGAR